MPVPFPARVKNASMFGSLKNDKLTSGAFYQHHSALVFFVFGIQLAMDR
jgi:hypothetical protein